MIFDEGLDFGIDSQLQHSSGSFLDDFIKRDAIVELPAKGEHFRIKLIAGWNVVSVCCHLAHSVPASGR